MKMRCFAKSEIVEFVGYRGCFTFWCPYMTTEVLYTLMGVTWVWRDSNFHQGGHLARGAASPPARFSSILELFYAFFGRIEGVRLILWMFSVMPSANNWNKGLPIAFWHVLSRFGPNKCVFFTFLVHFSVILRVLRHISGNNIGFMDVLRYTKCK